MKNLTIILAAFLFVPFFLPAVVPGRFMQDPDIYGDQIVFSYETDLWVVNATGGTALRLTSHPGDESSPKFSPDGQWIAFSGQYDRGSHVYLIPASGGAPKRLSYQHADARVVTWTPDARVVYRSGQENTFRPIIKLFAVTTDGGWPEKLPVPRGVLASFSGDGQKMIYCPRGREEYYWKRYKGGQFQDIWLYDYKSGSFAKLTDYVGKNSYPMWIGSAMYFVSDRSSDGISNIYRYDFAGAKTEQITHYGDFDVQMASSDGKKIVYAYSGHLYVLDPATGQSRRVEVRIPTDRWQLAERTINPKAFIQSMAIANDGKSAVFEARGDVFYLKSDGSALPRNLTKAADSRERFPRISPDGEKIAFFSDQSGEYELYVQAIDGGAWTRLTNGLKKTAYQLEWSPDGQKILFGDKDLTLWYVEVAGKKLVKIDDSNRLKNDEFTWEISDYAWSPDSKWVAYSHVQENRNSVIFLYNLAEAKRYAVTSEFYDNLNPTFDASGEYLYFLSYRDFAVQMDVFEDNHIISHPVQVMALQLKAGQKPPFAEHPEEGEKRADDPFRIDTARIQDRVYPLPVKSGNFFYAKAGAGKITWASIDDFTEDEYEELYRPGGADKWSLHIFDMADQKEVVIENKISDWIISTNGENILAGKRGDYYTQSLAKAFSSKDLGDKLDLEKMIYVVKPLQEWPQIFNDTWRWYRDFFYDSNMHGHDWVKIGDAYRAYLPELNSRQDLNWVLQQMVGQLCVSHTYVSGGDMGGERRPPENPVRTGFLGAELSPGENGYFRLSRIYGPTDLNRDIKGPLVRPDVSLAEGDYLIAIDGVEIKYPENPFKHLQVTDGQKVKITFNKKPAAAGAQTCETEPVTSEYALRYNRWVTDNIARVAEASQGDFGYTHLTAMGGSNVGQFDRYWRAFRYKKGLVVDVRGNGGGWTEYFIIDKLERRQVAYNTMQGVESFRYPNSASRAHYVVVSNEYNGSDGEAFIEHFKARKLGTVVGVPSWGGLVGIINGQKTIDGGTVHQSNNAFFGDEGKWLVENHGADPDIYVENDPAAEMAGRDPQLEKALEVLRNQDREKPWTFPDKPAYPKR